MRGQRLFILEEEMKISEKLWALFLENSMQETLHVISGGSLPEAHREAGTQGPLCHFCFHPYSPLEMMLATGADALCPNTASLSCTRGLGFTHLKPHLWVISLGLIGHHCDYCLREVTQSVNHLDG